uniref:WD and tetratricopeptide repeats protein 1 n=1 Tax=Anthurium amnicola TaxID=1678845 RepID=A0A1D1ZD60_9ARAE
MEAAWNFPDGNITGLLESRERDSAKDVNYKLHTHSSLIQRLALERELKGHQGCVNALAWNARGSLLVSGSDDTRINIWGYPDRRLINSIDTGHSANIFCTRFIPETSDELVVSGAGDAEVRLFHLSRSSGRRLEQISPEPLALFQCHSKRVKKLAVEVGNPNVVWSASEDGTLRQHDLREGASCPPVGAPNQECRNVLLDLRSGAKKSLADSPKQCLGLKSCDISPTRPHQFLVGGSDAFGRLYDRRMLPPLSSCRAKMKPPPCVNYFCPIHLSDRRSSNLHLTHVAFSPNGEEVLLSYSGEHVYLMNVHHDDQLSMRYCADDVPKRMYLPPVLDGLEAFPCQPASPKNIPRRKGSSVRLDMYVKLLQTAAESLEEGSNYLYGIEACSEILDGKGPEIDGALKHECLCIRAGLFLKRKWKNDVHMAIRDCHRAQSTDALSFRSYYYLAEALTQLGKYQEALDYAMAAQYLASSNPEVAKQVKMIKEQLTAAESERCKENEKISKSEMQPGKRRTLSDVLFQSEVNDDASQGDHQFEREDSDYEEMELDFVSSISGDDSHDLESRIFRGSLNLRFSRGDESSRDNCSANCSNESSSSSTQNENAVYQHEFAIDMRQRYVGHCNVGTDIKQASFLGLQGEYIASGSDDGRWFIWEKRTGRLIKMLLGDEAVVNCVQCHPFDCTVVTSGIDYTIKIWTPHAQMPSTVGGTAGPETSEILKILARNQQKLFRNREMLPFEFLEHFRMHEFSEGNFHPFECAQS